MRILSYISFFIVVIVLSCCKKEKPLRIRYPEDTQDYDATPVERIANKWWVLDSVSVNGVDYTDTVYNLVGNYSIHLSSYRDGPNYLGHLRTDSALLTEPNYGLFALYWLLGEDLTVWRGMQSGLFKPNIFSYTSILYYPNSISYDYRIWKIHTITSNMLKVSLTRNDTTIINYFKKQ